MPATRPGAKGAVISGWGTALPEKIITNHELAATMDTSDEWIVSRTGIRERHVGGSTIGLSVESGRQALEMAGLDPARIDAVVLATTTPDTQWGNAAAVQHELGLRCGAYDVNAACSGFTYGLVTAHGLIAVGADRVLVIGTDTLSRITDWDDRTTAPLFADGSGAVVLESVDGPGQLLGWDLDADGSLLPILQAEVGGFIRMEGKEVFRRAVRIMVDSAEKSMRHAGVTADDIALDRAPPGEPADHRCRLRSPRHRPRPRRRGTRPHRQHVVGVDPARPRRCARPRPGPQRRPRPDRRFRRRHDRRLLRAPLGRWRGWVEPASGPTRRPGHRGVARDRPRMRAALPGAGRPRRRHVPQLAAARRPVRRAVRRHRRRPGRCRVRSDRSRVRRTGRGAGVERRRHQGRPAAAHERGRLRERHRRQPHRRVPCHRSAPRRACCGPARAASSSCRRWSACSAPPVRPTTPHRRPASSASPDRSPASSDRGASPSTSSRPDRSRPT